MWGTSNDDAVIVNPKVGVAICAPTRTKSRCPNHSDNQPYCS